MLFPWFRLVPNEILAQRVSPPRTSASITVIGPARGWRLSVGPDSAFAFDSKRQVRAESFSRGPAYGKSWLEGHWGCLSGPCFVLLTFPGIMPSIRSRAMLRFPICSSIRCSGFMGSRALQTGSSAVARSIVPSRPRRLPTFRSQTSAGITSIGSQRWRWHPVASCLSVLRYGQDVLLTGSNARTGVRDHIRSGEPLWRAAARCRQPKPTTSSLVKQRASLRTTRHLR